MKAKEILDKMGSNGITPGKVDFLLNINTRQIPLKDTGISPRVYNHWKTYGILPVSDNKSEKRKWEKLSFIEYLWLKCVEEMREFGVSMEIILKAKESLFALAPADELQLVMDNIQRGNAQSFLIERYNNFIADVNHSFLNEAEKQTLLAIVQSETFFEDLFKRIKYTLFELFIISALSNQQEFGIMIFKNKIVPYLDEILEIDKNNIKIFYKTHIYISITSIYFNLLTNDEMKKYSKSYLYLTDYENEVLNFIKREDYMEITIKKDKNETRISGKISLKYDVKKYKELKKQLTLKYPYCNMTEKRHAGKITSIEVVVKELIKK